MGDGILVVLSFHEFATDAARVLVADLVDLDGVVAAVEGDDELAVLVIGLRRHQLRIEAQNVHVLLEHLFHVDLGRLGLKLDHVSHGVLICAETVVCRDRLVLDGGRRCGQANWHLSDALLLLVPALGPVIAVVDIAVTAVDLDLLAAADVLRHVVLLVAEGHAWAVREDGSLGELLALEQLGEGGAARVLRVDLLNLNGVVRQEVHQSVELVTAIVGEIFPEDLEGEDAAVVIEELLEAAVRSSTLQLHFDVVLELGLVGWGLLHVDHGTGVRERIIGVVLSRANIDSLVGEVGSGELVAVNDAEDAVVHIQVHAELEIRPVVVRSISLLELGTLEEDALRNTGVGDAWLNDMERIVVQVEVKDALPDAIVLSGVLDDRLKEVGLEVEDLKFSQTKSHVS